MGIDELIGPFMSADNFFFQKYANYFPLQKVTINPIMPPPQSLTNFIENYIMKFLHLIVVYVLRFGVSDWTPVSHAGNQSSTLPGEYKILQRTVFFFISLF